MGTAYTPGLTVSADVLVRKTRKLPIKGTVFVRKGDRVSPDAVVARAQLPGNLAQVKVANLLGLNPPELPSKLLIKVGDEVKAGDPIARHVYFFNLIKNVVKAPASGVVEYISDVSGNVGIREAPVPIDLKAYIKGTVAEVLADEGVVVETTAALVQGIFGIGGERQGTIRLMPDPNAIIDEADLKPDYRGAILVGRSLITGRALRRAGALGVNGVVVGGIVDKELVELLGYEIGVAITGQEEVGTTLVLTEGFGEIEMAAKTFNLLRSLEGREASINGTTQIRAGVIRPEVIVPKTDGSGGSQARIGAEAQVLEVGKRIRVIREPYFGLLGQVRDLPPELIQIETGAKVRLLKARLDDGRDVIVPRANVEIV